MAMYYILNKHVLDMRRAVKDKCLYGHRREMFLRPYERNVHTALEDESRYSI
jgi:hypothetical protein